LIPAIGETPLNRKPRNGYLPGDLPVERPDRRPGQGGNLAAAAVRGLAKSR
jgi:hypothetical protein